MHRKNKLAQWRALTQSGYYSTLTAQFIYTCYNKLPCSSHLSVWAAYVEKTNPLHPLYIWNMVNQLNALKMYEFQFQVWEIDDHEIIATDGRVIHSLHTVIYNVQIHTETPPMSEWRMCGAERTEKNLAPSQKMCHSVDVRYRLRAESRTPSIVSRISWERRKQLSHDLSCSQAASSPSACRSWQW